MDSDDDRADFDDIRHELNLDEETIDDAFATFRRIQSHYSLEGEKMDWIACAVYTSCRKCITQTMGKVAKIEGNMVSLTRILRSCNISLVRFFNKMKNWTDMASLSDDMRSKLNQLERNFNVTTVIFKKYKPMFEDIFKCATQGPCRFVPKGRKGNRKQPLTSQDIFTFCWTLFVYIKSKYSQISDDLVNSYHLLVVCLDYCFYSVLSFDNYRDIVNSHFYESLQNELGVDPRSHNNDNRVSIIDMLCSKWNGIPIEVKQIKKHWFKPFLKTLIEKDEIKKRANGIIDGDVIDFNYKYLKREYEQFVLTIGDFDECVFLNETASEELGTAEFQSNESDLDRSILNRVPPTAAAAATASRINHDQPNALMPMTPLSSKDYLATHTPVNKSILLTPITSATTSISRLHSILIGRTEQPSIDLSVLFSRCKNNPKEKIAVMIKTMGDIFLASYSKENAAQSVIRKTDEIQYIVSDEFPKNRLNLAISFFYNVLEKLLNSELRRNQRLSDADLSAALARVIDQNIFLRSLFACSLEIVLHSYSPTSRLFPWILDIFNDYEDLKIHSFHFYKVIEPIIRDEQGLSREIVKHLNAVEEKILERLAWSANSPVWAFLKASSSGAPTYEEVFPDSNLLHNSPAASKVGGSVTDVGGNVRTAKRQLNFNGNDQDQNGSAPQDKNEKPEAGQASSVVVKEEISDCADKNSQAISADLLKSPMKGEGCGGGSIKVNSNVQLKLFYRKVYNLAHLRLCDLATRLSIKEELTKMIWTCLVHSLSAHPELMCDHHLDQMIMCSIFCICKLNQSVTFGDIIKEYRMQPQAVNYVYRNVQLAIFKPEGGEFKGTNAVDAQQKRAPLTPTKENGAKASIGCIIDFYNKVFINILTEAYILQFSPAQTASLTLSPMPRNNKFSSPNIHSPIRRVSNYPNIFISPLRTSGCPPSPNRGKSYRFQSNQSASNDLKAINNMMKSSIAGRTVNGQSLSSSAAMALLNSGAGVPSPNVKRVSKRILQDDLESDSSQSSKMPCLNRKINDIMADRNQIFSASSSANVSGTDDSSDSLQFNNHHHHHHHQTGSLGISGLTRVSPIMGTSHDSLSNNATAAAFNAKTSPRLLVIDTGLDGRPIGGFNGIAPVSSLMPSAVVNAVAE